MIYGYARISKPKQSIDRQVRNILSYAPDAKAIKEAYTGTTQERPEWIKLQRRIAAGDTIIFDSVSRMSRNAEEGFAEYETLFGRGINLIFLKEQHINTDTFKRAAEQQIALTGNKIADEYIKATNNVLLLIAKEQIKLAFIQAEKEVIDLHTRTSEGIKTEKLNGKQIGRVPGASVTTKKSIQAKQIIERYSSDFSGTLNDTDVMCLIGDISRNSYYKYKRELRKES